MFTEMILDKLQVFYDDPAKDKHGSCPEITYGYLIETILNSRGTCSAHSLFPIGQQTFNRMMRNCFPLVKLNGGNQTWFFYLLSVIDHKLCGQCNNIKPLSSFSINKNSSSLGVSSLCKECKNTNQEGQYSKYIESHKKSYEKYSAEIKARQQLYKGERSLRVPLWYETQKKEIENIYRNCPQGHQVDHIIPLKGTLVSGLHVASNLQYLSVKDNLAKGSKYEIN